jgi:hypothetical protein
MYYLRILLFVKWILFFCVLISFQMSVSFSFCVPIFPYPFTCVWEEPTCRYKSMFGLADTGYFSISKTRSTRKGGIQWSHPQHRPPTNSRAGHQTRQDTGTKSQTVYISVILRKYSYMYIWYITFQKTNYGFEIETFFALCTYEITDSSIHIWISVNGIPRYFY